MEYDNDRDNDNRTNNASSDRNGSNTSFNEDVFADAESYFIGSAIEAGRNTIESCRDLIRFTVNTVNEQLFWLRIYRWFFIMEKLVTILKIIFEIIL